MERKRELDIRKYSEAVRITNQNARRGYGHRFRSVTTDDLSMILNISIEDASAFLKSYLDSHPLPKSNWVDRDQEISLDVEHNRQATKMAQLFAETLSLTKEAYVNSIPPFPEKPEPAVGLNWRPLIVEGSRIPWREQVRLSRIMEEFGYLIRDVRDWDKHSEGFITPQKPYATWVSMRKETPSDINHSRRNLIPSERGGTILEGIAFWNAYPDIASGGLFSLPGSQGIRLMRQASGFKESPYTDSFYLDCLGGDNSLLEPRAILKNYANRENACHAFISSREIKI